MFALSIFSCLKKSYLDLLIIVIFIKLLCYMYKMTEIFKRKTMNHNDIMVHVYISLKISSC